MILQNLIIGIDAQGKELKCGDICSYKYDNVERKGMIIYDEETYSFAFEQLDDKFPLILMSLVEFDTIKKNKNINQIINNYPNAKEWKEIYNNNLWAIKN